MPHDRSPDLAALADCGLLVAKAMNRPEPERARAIAFFDEILRGQRDLWLCAVEGWITEAELRNAVMDRFATWLLEENGVNDPEAARWVNPEAEREILRSCERALFGRPLDRPE
jgi:hypothetical protein